MGAETNTLSTHSGIAVRMFARVRRRLAPLRQSVVAYALALIAIFWLGAQLLIYNERISVHNSLKSEAHNIAIILEENVAHTVNDLDRILKFVRLMHNNNPDRAWSSIIGENYTIDDETVQIAVIDAKGMMITSTAMPHPSQPIDLSDREHFQAQLKSKNDELFISKPMIGRASGKASVQFSRRLTDKSGNFAGIVVISLDPTHLARAYPGLDLGRGFGLALIGDDGVVRAGAGAFSGLLGDVFPGSDALKDLFALDVNVAGETVAVDRDDLFEVVRSVQGFPLNVAVSMPGISTNRVSVESANSYHIAAACISILTLLITSAVARRRYLYEQQMVALAKKDSLTELPNRFCLNEELDRIFKLPVARRDFALHMIDLDGFKFVNDTYGHLVGDRLLQAVAARILSLLTHGELVARMGGDEFAILQPVHNFYVDSTALAKKINYEIGRPYELDDIRADIGASIGVASARNDSSNAPELIKAADLALYFVKSNGRGRFRFYDATLSLSLKNRMAIETGLRTALENGEFKLHYQPIKRLTDGVTVGFEALLRWNHPERGLIMPGDFISIAEETGLIVPIGDWVLRQACMDISKRPGRYRIAVNCSPKQFEGTNLASSVRNALKASGLAPDRLDIEITETMLVKDDQRVTQQLHDIRSIGVGISMDDFGTGYSSLSYLNLYPINTLKIDRAFVRDISRNERSQSLVRAIVQLAASFDMGTIAEGIETEEQLGILKRLGCHEAQGYYFSRPVPLEDLFPTVNEENVVRRLFA